MASNKDFQPINLQIIIPPDINAAAAGALGESLARFLAQFAGQGTPAQNHRQRTATAAKEVSDAPDGEWTAKQYRDWYRDEWIAKGGEPLVNPETKKEFPLRGVLTAFWRDWIDQIRVSEAAGDQEPEEFFGDGEVEETDEPTVQAVEAPVTVPSAAPEVPTKGRRNR